MWIHGSNVACSNSDRVDNELMALLAKKNVEFRAFSSSSIADACYRSIASLGNSIPVHIDTTSYSQIVDYINEITPDFLFNARTQPFNLVVLDTAFSATCDDGLNITLPLDYGIEKLLLSVTNYIYTPGDKEEILPNAIYSLSPQSLSLKFLDP